MFEFIKKAHKKATNEKPETYKHNNTVEEYTPVEESKKTHGEDGVCCGGCGGQ